MDYVRYNYNNLSYNPELSVMDGIMLKFIKENKKIIEPFLIRYIKIDDIFFNRPSYSQVNAFLCEFLFSFKNNNFNETNFIKINKNDEEFMKFITFLYKVFNNLEHEFLFKDINDQIKIIITKYNREKTRNKFLCKLKEMMKL